MSIGFITFFLLSRGDNFSTLVDMGWITRVDSCKGSTESSRSLTPIDLFPSRMHSPVLNIKPYLWQGDGNSDGNRQNSVDEMPSAGEMVA